MAPDNESRFDQLDVLRTGPEQVLVAGNRGACGGVNMAIDAVDIVMKIVPPESEVFVSHAPVNFRPAFEKYGDRLRNVGGDISRVPDGGNFIISAHGAPPEIYEEAERRGITVIDTTCAIVKDEQRRIVKDVDSGHHVIFIGEEDHPETIGIRAQVSDGITVLDPRRIKPLEDVPDGAKVYSKTTNTPDDVAEVIRMLRESNPTIDDSQAHQCYATYNRQLAARKLVKIADFWLVVGDVASHNSRMLQRIGVDSDIPSVMVSRANEVDLEWFKAVKSLGVTSGASVPEEFTQEILDIFRTQGIPIVMLDQVQKEVDRTFKLPAFDALVAKYGVSYE